MRGHITQALGCLVLVAVDVPTPGTQAADVLQSDSPSPSALTVRYPESHIDLTSSRLQLGIL